jgi:flagellar basal-body rod protein FlgG
MNVLQKKQENNAANTANVNTPGYKYQQLIQTAMEEHEVYNHAGGRDNNETRLLGTINFGTAVDEAYTSFSQGMLKETGVFSDLALTGKGFFAVRLEDGETGFTRNGNFRIGPDRRLVTQEGYPVLGVDNGGNAQEIFVENDRFTVDNKGYINGGNLRVMTVDFADYASFEMQGETLYVRGQEDIQAADVTMSQGWLESSNVNLLDEVVKMMEVSREFESSQRALKVLNETLQKTVNEIGRN